MDKLNMCQPQLHVHVYTHKWDETWQTFLYMINFNWCLDIYDSWKYETSLTYIKQSF